MTSLGILIKNGAVEGLRRLQDADLYFCQEFFRAYGVPVIDLIGFKWPVREGQVIFFGVVQKVLYLGSVLSVISPVAAGEIAAGGKDKIIVRSFLRKHEKYGCIYIGDPLFYVLNREKCSDRLVAEVANFSFMFLVQFLDEEIHLFIPGNIFA